MYIISRIRSCSHILGERHLIASLKLCQLPKLLPCLQLSRHLTKNTAGWGGGRIRSVRLLAVIAMSSVISVAALSFPLSTTFAAILAAAPLSFPLSATFAATLSATFAATLSATLAATFAAILAALA